jgi:hypothetical protein
LKKRPGLFIGFLILVASSWGGNFIANGQACGSETLSLTKELQARIDKSGELNLLQAGKLLVRGGLAVLDNQNTWIFQNEMNPENMLGDSGEKKWSLELLRRGGRIRGHLKICQHDNNAIISIEASIRQPETVGKFGYLFQLAAPVHLGKQLQFHVGGQKVLLPKKAGKKLLLDCRGRLIWIFAGKKLLLQILRDIDTRITLTDNRVNGGQGFNLLLEAGSVDRGGSSQSRFCLALGSGQPLKPYIYHAKLWRPAVVGGPLRAEIGFVADWDSAFDPGQVRLDLHVKGPGGKKWTQPGFFGQSYSSSIKKLKVKQPKTTAVPATEKIVETQILISRGQPGWRVLVAATKAGSYSTRAEVVTGIGSASVEIPPVNLLRVPARRMGPLLPSKRDHRYMRDPQGKGVFLLGHNVAWLLDLRGTVAWQETFARMAKAGLVYTRIWNCSWSLNIETSRPYAYDLANAWRLDQIMASAKEAGIHVQLCLDNFYDFRMKRLESPFFSGPKPVCKTTADFFTLKSARQMHFAKLRYMVARYGHCQNLMAWELWNELDYCFDKAEDAEGLRKARGDYLVDWALSTARALRRLDRNRRAVACSLADGTIWPELSGAEEIGLVESHIYLYKPNPKLGTPSKSAREEISRVTVDFNRYRKPGFVSEFGFGADGGPISPTNDEDRLAVHLHNGLWLSTMYGHAGAVASWWWDSYLAAPVKGQENGSILNGEDRYWHYSSLGKFLRGIDWLAGWKDLRVGPPTKGTTLPFIKGLRTKSQVLVWVADRQNWWYGRVAEEYIPKKISGVTFGVDGLLVGNYQVTWWDTYNGKVLTTVEQDTDSRGRLQISVPTFRRDVAAKIKLLKKAPLAK